MVNSMKTSGQTTYGLKRYVLDTPDDIKELPYYGIPAGSTAFVISTSENYMMNSKGEWVKVQMSSGSGSSSGGGNTSGGNNNPSTPGSDAKTEGYLFYGLVKDEPDSLSGLSNVKVSKEDLLSTGYTYKGINTNNQIVALAIPKSFGIECYEISVSGFGIGFNSKVIDNYIIYYDYPSTGSYRYLYKFEEA